MSAAGLPTATPGSRQRLLRFVVWALAALLAAATWLAYQRADLLLDLATLSLC